MTTYKIILAYLSIVIGIIGYIPYFRGIFSGKTKPHAFSWLVWSLLVGITFAAQLTSGGGAGAWVTGFTATVCFIIFLLSFAKGDKHFILFDWVALGMALLALALWRVTNDPTLSVILLTLTDALSFLPTLRKGFYKPHEDSPILWALTVTKWTLSMFALQSFSLVTLLYPVYLIIINAFFTVLLIVRKKQVAV